MAFETDLMRMQKAIGQGKVSSFEHIFKYIKQSHLANKTGIDPQRLQYITYRPFAMRPEEIEQITAALGFKSAEFAKLLFNAL